MPANRPGRVAYVTNGGTALQHGAPVKNGSFVGTAIKQRQVGWDSVVADQTVIAASEPFAIIVKGKVLVPQVSGFAKGDAIYIVAADNSLTKTAGSNFKFGIVTEPPADRGTPAGKCWIDLDLKSSI